MSLFTCDWDACPGHLAKFPNCLAEALYNLSLEGLYNDATGSVEYEGHFTLFAYGPTESGSTVDMEDGTVFHVPPGYYILIEDERGSVSVVEYHTEEEARESFATSDIRYGRWLEATMPESESEPDVPPEHVGHPPTWPHYIDRR